MRAVSKVGWLSPGGVGGSSIADGGTVRTLRAVEVLLIVVTAVGVGLAIWVACVEVVVARGRPGLRRGGEPDGPGRLGPAELSMMQAERGGDEMDIVERK
jgi:hypothetical protein